MVVFKISVRFLFTVELCRRAREAGLHFDDYIYLRKFEQSNVGCLKHTFELYYRTIATSVGAQNIAWMYDDGDHITVPNWPDIERQETMSRCWHSIQRMVKILRL